MRQKLLASSVDEVFQVHSSSRMLGRVGPAVSPLALGEMEAAQEGEVE